MSTRETSVPVVTPEVTIALQPELDVIVGPEILLKLSVKR